MSTLRRGAKNAFRNATRTISIVVILAISMSLALVMLLSLQAVNSKISSVQSSGGNTITITPAGSFGGFGGGGNPFTAAQVETIAQTEHVVGIAATVTDRLQNSASTSTGSGGFGGGGRFGGTGGTTSLESPIDPSGLAQRFGGSLPAGFSLPVEVVGTNAPENPIAVNATSLTYTSGKAIDGLASTDVADVGTDLATKNHLVVGSTFTAYDKTFTVVGIFSAGTTRADATFIIPLATEEALSGVTGPTSVTVRVDTVGNVTTTSNAITAALGSNVADVTSSVSRAATEVADLHSIHTIALYSLIGALVAAAVILLLSMLMIVRERRREIGIVKAFGSSNGGVVATFITESLTLTAMGGVVGIILGIAMANPVLSVLVNTQSSSGGNGFGGGFGGHFGGGGGPGGFGGGPPSGGGGGFGGFGFHPGSTLHDLHAAIGGGTIALAVLGIIVIAILGSAVPSYVIAKVRPAEVLRGE